MKKILVGFVALSMAFASTALAQEASPREQAEQAAADAMARAMAEKARNDEIVRQQQLEGERQRQEQEQRVRDLEEAQRRANTG